MKISNDYFIKQVGEKYFVFCKKNTTDDQMFVINESGFFIWNILIDGATEKQLLDSFTKKYDVDYKTAAQDIEEFLQVIRSCNVLEE